jgi:preprotein translocase subunit SecG
MELILPWIQIGLALILILTVILQQTGAGVGGAFGGGDGSAINRTRRGAERTLFQVTIVIGILFALSALATFFFRG